MRRKYSKNTGPMLPGFETYETADDTTLNLSTLSPADSHVRTSALQENGKDLKANAQRYGQNSTASFAKLDQTGHWLKTYRGYYQATMDASLEKYCGTWPREGSMQNGELYRRAPLVPHTHANACFSLPTVTKSDGGLLESCLNDSMSFVPDAITGKPRRLTTDGKTWSCGLTRLWLLTTGKPMPPQVAEWLMGFPIDWTE